jgi:hypothetical protein
MFFIRIYNYYCIKSYSTNRNNFKIFNSSMQNQTFSFGKIRNKMHCKCSINNNDYIWYSK